MHAKCAIRRWGLFRQRTRKRQAGGLPINFKNHETLAPARYITTIPPFQIIIATVIHFGYRERAYSPASAEREARAHRAHTLQNHIYTLILLHYLTFYKALGEFYFCHNDTFLIVLLNNS